MGNDYLDKATFESRISNISNVRDRLIALLLYDSGLTVSELINLQVSHLQNTSILVSQRKIDLSKRSFEALNKYLAKYGVSKYVFFTRQSPQMTSRRIEQVLKSYSLVSPSKLRRSSVINALKEESVTQVKEKYSLKSLRVKNYLSKEEYSKIFNSVNVNRDKILFSLFYDVGITVSQAVNLKVSDIKQNKILVQSDDRFTYQTNLVSLPVSLISLLQNYILENSLSSNSYFFSSRQSSQLSPRRIQQIFKSYSTKFNLELTPQILANSAKRNSVSSSLNLSLDLVSQQKVRVPRIYEGYHGVKGNGGESEVT